MWAQAVWGSIWGFGEGAENFEDWVKGLVLCRALKAFGQIWLKTRPSSPNSMYPRPSPFQKHTKSTRAKESPPLPPRARKADDRLPAKALCTALRLLQWRILESMHTYIYVYKTPPLKTQGCRDFELRVFYESAGRIESPHKCWPLLNTLAG